VRRNRSVTRLIDDLRYVHGIAASEQGGNPLTDSVAVQILAALGFSQDCQAERQHAQVTLQVLRERSFAIRDDDMMVYGIIDRLVLFRRHDRVLAADMVDFKSDTLAVDKASDMRHAIETYRPQLAMYRWTIARQFGLDIDHVRARPLFLQLGAIWQIED